MKQVSLDSYFKSKSSSTSLNQHNQRKQKMLKRHSLSLKKPPTPTKVTRVECDVSILEPEDVVVNLCSDEENLPNTPVKAEADTIFQAVDETIGSANSSASTIIYSLTPQTTPQTPEKSTNKSFKSPSSSNKFYSPNKKRAVFKKSPAKRNLANEWSSSQNSNVEDEVFVNACEGMDDKTKFMLTTIHTCLNTDGLSSLLSANSRDVLQKCLHVTKPGAWVICRMYWRQPQWFRKDNLKKLCENVDDPSFCLMLKNMLENGLVHASVDEAKFMLTTIHTCLNTDGLNSLLPANSRAVLQKCLHVTKPGAWVICRMYWRQPQWFRKDNLKKLCENVDDPSFCLMLNNMLENGLVHASVDEGGNDCMTFDDYANVLKADEIKQICKHFKIKILSKQDAVKGLKSFSRRSSISMFYTGTPSNNASRVLELMRSKAGPCYKLSDQTRQALYELYLLMYLGMSYDIIRTKGLELLLINNKINRETYPIDKNMDLDDATVVFNNEDEFYKYLKAHLIYEEYLAETENKKKCDIVNEVYNLYKNIPEDDMIRYKSYPVWLHRYTPTYLYVKILASGIQELKKIESNQVALDIVTLLINQIAFRQHKKAEWYAEKALILHKLFGLHDEAAKVLLEGFNSNLSCEAKDAMRPRANKIANQQNIKLDDKLRQALLGHVNTQILEKKFSFERIDKQPMENDKQRGKKKFRVDTEDGRKYYDAEEYCVYHYTSNGTWTHGEHWEGRIITTIFTLLFWDIIYTKPRGVNGVFLSYFQRHPLDMHFESFYINRKTLIDEWLHSIENMETSKMVEIIKDKWDERPDHELSGINRNIGWDNIRMVAVCLGSVHTAAICRRLATNYGYAHSGFPDLTLWNVNTGKIKFVEVKTDTDKPSMKQLQWMQYLTDNGIDTGFCYLGVHTVKHKARALI